MPNETQGVMDSLLKRIPFKNCYIDDILVTSKGTVEVHKTIVPRKPKTLDKNNIGVKWGKAHFS